MQKSRWLIQKKKKERTENSAFQYIFALKRKIIVINKSVYYDFICSVTHTFRRI